MAEKILVVDDDIDTLRLVGLMLQRQGYQIVAASNGQQALQMAHAEKPDLILLDVMMPDMDGYEVTRRLRADTQTNTIPIIMFTAKTQVDDKVTGFEAGADDYLTKPTQPRELFAHVKAVLARSMKGRLPAVASSSLGSDRGRAIGIIAAKGGLGISTLTLNLGISLSNRTQKEVVVAEYRPGHGSIGLDLGYNRPEGLLRLLQKKPKDLTSADIETELVTHSSSRVRLLLSSFQPADARYMLAGESFDAITNHLTHIASVAALDLGPGISPISDRVLGLCDQVIVAVEAAPGTLLRTRALLDELANRGFGEERLLIVLYNRHRLEMQLTLTQVQEQLRASIALVFTPAPEVMYQAARNGTPLVALYPDNLTSQQFGRMAELIMKDIPKKA